MTSSVLFGSSVSVEPSSREEPFSSDPDEASTSSAAESTDRSAEPQLESRAQRSKQSKSSTYDIE